MCVTIVRGDACHSSMRSSNRTVQGIEGIEPFWEGFEVRAFRANHRPQFFECKHIKNSTACGLLWVQLEPILEIYFLYIQRSSSFCVVRRSRARTFARTWTFVLLLLGNVYLSRLITYSKRLEMYWVLWGSSFAKRKGRNALVLFDFVVCSQEELFFHIRRSSSLSVTYSEWVCQLARRYGINWKLIATLNAVQRPSFASNVRVAWRETCSKIDLIHHLPRRLMFIDIYILLVPF